MAYVRITSDNVRNMLKQ